MAKANKTFSLDTETIEILEQYCEREDALNGGTVFISRSKLVNDAICWFLKGDTAELVHNNERLVEAVKRANRAITESEPTSLPWWRRLLLGR